MEKKILIVDDDPGVQDSLRYNIEDLGGKTLKAFTAEEAMETLLNNPDIVAIIVDGCLSGSGPDTAPLVVEMRKSYTGPIWGNTAHPRALALLKEAGCDIVFNKTSTRPEENLLKHLPKFFAE